MAESLDCPNFHTSVSMAIVSRREKCTSFSAAIGMAIPVFHTETLQRRAPETRWQSGTSRQYLGYSRSRRQGTRWKCNGNVNLRSTFCHNTQNYKSTLSSNKAL